jgi:hypothetical protein
MCRQAKQLSSKSNATCVRVCGCNAVGYADDPAAKTSPCVLGQVLRHSNVPSSNVIKSNVIPCDDKCIEPYPPMLDQHPKPVDTQRHPNTPKHAASQHNPGGAASTLCRNSIGGQAPAPLVCPTARSDKTSTESVVPHWGQGARLVLRPARTALGVTVFACSAEKHPLRVCRNAFHDATAGPQRNPSISGQNYWLTLCLPV